MGAEHFPGGQDDLIPAGSGRSDFSYGRTRQFRWFASVFKVGAVDRVFAVSHEDRRASAAERVAAVVVKSVGAVDAGDDNVVAIGASNWRGASAFARRNEIEEGA